MFERFTERAVNAVSESQRLAKDMNSAEVCPEHLLLALVMEAKGVSLKLFRMYNVTPELDARRGFEICYSTWCKEGKYSF